MLLFIPRSLCALKRIAAKTEHCRFGATQGIRIALTPGLYRAEATDGRRAMIVQGEMPAEDPPWPGFKEVPDDACETIVMPKDLERACKLGDYHVSQIANDTIGLATVGNDVYLGRGSDLINTRIVDGRFPSIDQVIPKQRPLFTFRVDPKLLAEVLLAMADLLPDHDKAVQFFYYGDGIPLGFCAKNGETGLMIDALVVPVTRVDATQDADESVDDEEEPAEKSDVDDQATPQPDETSPPETEAEKPGDQAEANGHKKRKKKAKAEGAKP